MKITVIGIGYVGLASAITLAKKYEVCLVDINHEKVKAVCNKISPVSDNSISEALIKEEMNLTATSNLEEGLQNSEYVILAISTNYSKEINNFDMKNFESTISKILMINPNINIIIKSTVPFGFLNKIYCKDKCNIMYVPEFLREGFALEDSRNPSRIIVGIPEKKLLNKAKEFIKIMLLCIGNKQVPTIITNFREAECIKLFSNAYLAMRVAFFNELDMFAESNNLNTKTIIEGMGYDKRIGDLYNNPSFGYGGYCLPKDVKQLVTHYDKIPSVLIPAIVKSNDARKEYISANIKKKIRTNGNKQCVGIYRLAAKKNVSNMRESAVLDIIDMLKKEEIDILIYEPDIKDINIEGCKTTTNLARFAKETHLIIANRMNSGLKFVKDKVYTRDAFFRD